MQPNLFAYDHDAPGNGPHAVQLRVSGAARREFFRAQQDSAEQPFGRWVTVVDLLSGRVYDVRPAPCGLGCRCAAEAKLIQDVPEGACAS